MALLLRSLVGAFLILRLQALKGSHVANLGHANGETDAAEAKVAMQKKSVLSSSMQDYLNQISQLGFAPTPDVAIPGKWLTDPRKSLIFLPVKVPPAMPLDEIKFLSDGRSLLVNVVARPTDAPEDESTKKYRMVLEAFKYETKGDLKALDAKLKEWELDEMDPRVQALIHSALAANGEVDTLHQTPRSITIPLSDISLLGVREQIAAEHAQKRDAVQEGIRVANPHGGAATIRLRSTYLQQASKTSDARSPDSSDGGNDPNLITIPLNAQLIQALVKSGDYVVPLDDQAAFASDNQRADQSYIKESLSVQLPYPTEATSLFAVEQSKGKLVIIMPYVKTKTARSDQAFARVPVYDMQGHMLVRSSAATTELSPVSHAQTTHQKSGEPAKTGKTVPSKPAQGKLANATEAKKLIIVGDA